LLRCTIIVTLTHAALESTHNNQCGHLP